MTIQITLTEAEAEEVSRRFQFDQVNGRTKRSSADQFFADIVRTSIRDWRLERTQQELTALAAKAVDDPTILEAIRTEVEKVEARA